MSVLVNWQIRLVTIEQNTTAQLRVNPMLPFRRGFNIYPVPYTEGNTRESCAGLLQQQGSPSTRHNLCSPQELSPIQKPHWSYWKFSLTNTVRSHRRSCSSVAYMNPQNQEKSNHTKTRWGGGLLRGQLIFANGGARPAGTRQPGRDRHTAHTAFPTETFPRQGRDRKSVV